MVNNVIYTVTSAGCNETPDAVWAIDVTGDVPKVTSYVLSGGELSGPGGPVIGSDGTVYGRTSGKLLALNAGDLRPKGYYTSAGEPSPLVFQYKNRELIVSAEKDGRISLLDSTSFGGNHETPLHRTAAGSGIYGGLATWQDAAGAR